MIVAVRPAERLFDRVIDDAQPQQVGRGELQGGGRLFRVLAALPEDAGAPFGADDRIVGVLEHGHAVAHTDAQCAAAAPFANDNTHDGRLEPRHLEHVLGNDLRLTALFGADARVGARGIHEAYHRQAELGPHPHLGQRLAIPLGMCAAEVAGAALLDGASLLMSHHHDLVLVEPGEAASDGAIVSEVLVAVQLDELVEHLREVVGRLGSILVSRDLNRLPGTQIRIDALDGVGQLAAEAAYFVFVTGAGLERLLGVAQPRFQFDDRLFKCQWRGTVLHRFVGGTCLWGPPAESWRFENQRFTMFVGEPWAIANRLAVLVSYSEVACCVVSTARGRDLNGRMSFIS